MTGSIMSGGLKRGISIGSGPAGDYIEEQYKMVPPHKLKLKHSGEGLNKKEVHRITLSPVQPVQSERRIMAKKDFLKEYHKKRNFKITAEPFGGSKRNGRKIFLSNRSTMLPISISISGSRLTTC